MVRMSAANPLIPNAFWFRYGFTCERIDAMPRRTDGSARQPLLGLPERCLLPDPASLDGREAWSRLRVAWNPGGLGVAVEVDGLALEPDKEPDASETANALTVWVDTRDTRDIHRASRHCQRFTAWPSLAPGRAPTPQVRIAQRPIARALAEPPRVRPELIRAWLLPRADGWTLELFFPAEVLHGFDPDTNRRLGFLAMVTDRQRGDRTLAGIGREFPVGEDPSLWPTLELRDATVALGGP
jgi:hypothetical protein